MARTTVPAADQLIDKPIPVLDHGFVRLVDYMGGDERIVQAASAVDRRIGPSPSPPVS